MGFGRIPFGLDPFDGVTTLFTQLTMVNSIMQFFIFAQDSACHLAVPTVDANSSGPNDQDEARGKAHQRFCMSLSILLCTPGMGVDLWGESPLCVNPVMS